VRLDLNDVGEQVPARQRQVLHNQVEVVVGVLDARDRDVANLEEDWNEKGVVRKKGRDKPCPPMSAESRFGRPPTDSS
jgi:hypothetical protein